MYRVGDFIVENIANLDGDDVKALFVRTAFNRYYYSCFHVIAPILKSEFNKKEIKHKEIPQYFLSEYKQLRKRLKKSGVANSPNVQRCLSILGKALREYKAFHEEIYNVRATADYNFSEQVLIDSSNFKIGNVSVHQARQWTSATEWYKGIILREFRNLGHGG